ncbi:MAG TPA: N-acetyl-gamma-glutamyl-phosphate reductase [Ktedonobacterales bacterium]|nr:N-acetyl-gamma-glutamyl-phosphate reductase [Ktedonobacterales bacterium]
MDDTATQHAGAALPVAVVAGTGYGGVELLRLLRRHPGFALVEVTARSAQGQRVCDVFPQLPDVTLPISERVERAELVFLAQPDHAAVESAPPLLAEGRRVVDLSAAFRLRAPALYPEWYGYEHPAPALLESAVYGLPELHRAELPAARLVACPGCYPTAAVLALAPALALDLIEPGIIVDAKSGLSGAGRGLTLGTHYAEANEDVSAYGLAGHRHLPEIVQELEGVLRERAGGAGAARVTFTPHLVPMTRGILATCYADLRPGVSAAAVRAAYEEAYRAEPFVHVLAQPPHTTYATGTNHTFIYPTVDARTGRLVVVGALDNLGKGAAAQAIQCANLMAGLAETTGLDDGGVYP